MDEILAPNNTANSKRTVTGKRAFRCGNSLYHVSECHGYLLVERQGFFGNTFIGFASNLPSALSMIRRDAKSVRLWMA